MINIINPEFFTIKHYEVFHNDGSCDELINVHGEPKDIELPKHKSSPFMSARYVTQKRTSSGITELDLIDKLNSFNYEQLSVYKESKYDTVSKIFIDKYDDIKFHTIIFNESEKYTNNNLAIIAIPCTGIIHHIPKSQHYKLYNASLVVTNRPFRYKGNFYNKILYALVDIISHFSFNEFIFTNSPDDVRIMNTHYFALSTITSDDEIFQPPINVAYTKLSSLVPCSDAIQEENRRELYSYAGGNMFYLSDIPEGVSLKGTTMSVKLSTDDSA